MGVERRKRSATLDVLPIREDVSEAMEMTEDYPGRGSPSRSSSFHSSDGDGAEREPDTLDCSGSRPLLMDSEEDEESNQLQPVLPNTPTQSVYIPQERPLQEGSLNLLPFETFHHTSVDALQESDVFSTAPFKGSRVVDDDSDIFTNAPFFAKSTFLPGQAQEADVFLQAPFTRKLSFDKTSLPSPTSRGGPPEVRNHEAYIGQGCEAQTVIGPVFQNVERVQGATLIGCNAPRSAAGFTHQTSHPSHSITASEHQDCVPPKGDQKDSVANQNHKLSGPELPSEILLGTVVTKPFRPQSLSKYSRHYSLDDGAGFATQPLAAYKVVSHSNKPVIAGSVSIPSLSSRTMELSGGDPFASAPFPSKTGRPNP